MPRKNKEELAAETTSTEETIAENTVEASADDDSANVEAASEAETETKEAAAEEPSFIESIAETVGATIGSAAATVTDSISSVVSAITSDSSTTESGKSHHNKRAERIGIVQSDKMTKTVTVRVERQVKHPIYRKYIKRRKNFMAHDEKGAAIGDKVRIVETRPLSARKRWRVVEIIQKAVK